MIRNVGKAAKTLLQASMVILYEREKESGASGMIRKRSIFRKYLIFFITAGFLPIIISAFAMFGLYEKNTVENTMNSVDYLLNYLVGSIANVADDMKDINSFINEQSREIGLTENLIAQKKGDNRSEQREEMINRIAGTAINMNPYVKGVVFVGTDNKVYGDTRISGLLNKNYNCAYIPAIQDYLSGNLTDDFISPHKMNYYTDDTEVISFVTRFTYVGDAEEKPEVLGVMFVDVYLESIGVFFNNLNKDMLSILYLADSEGDCIYSINEAWIGRRIYEYQIHKTSETSKMGDKLRYFKTQNIPGFSWTLVGGTDYDYLMGKINTVKRLTFLIISVGVFTCLCLAFLGSRAFTKPINRILSNMRLAQQGNLEARVEMHRKDEIGQIADGFDEMLSRMKEYINRVYLLQIKQKDAELTALKTQIQPHFLYNTLEVIRMQAVSNGDDVVAEMISSLAEQFRYLIDNTSDEVYVSEELKIIEKYFCLIDVRYGGRITLALSVSNHVKNLKIPRLTIQTIVENAVIHGLKIKGGSVSVRGYTENHTDIIEIIDNGVGMSSERLNEINRAIGGEKENISQQAFGSGIGLKNVSERLNMFYGERSSMTVESIENVGTSVKICIKREEETNV